MESDQIVGRAAAMRFFMRKRDVGEKVAWNRIVQ